MLAETEVIILPYAGGEEKTLLHLLIKEFKSDSWNHFSAAIAFAKQSGNYPELLESMLHFAEGGGSIEMTFGADLFGAGVGATEYEAIKTLLTELGKNENVKLYLYHERGRTFHPKLYLFANEGEKRGLLIIGSSNWSYGGFVDNIEANVFITLNLADGDHQECYDTIKEFFKTYWEEMG